MQTFKQLVAIPILYLLTGIGYINLGLYKTIKFITKVVANIIIKWVEK